ncbi:MAG: flavin reductase family protein [Oligoflexia bacterium]|jgi:flavin reductase (DIM6/NTAB) family NADH-FMN oxidoreductase RutF
MVPVKFLDPTELGQQQMYKLLTGGVVPRPVATVSTISPEGVFNVAPFSFYNAVSSDPPCLSVSIARNSQGQKKDTLRNIEAIRQFVINATPVSLMKSIHQASAEYPYGVSEFEKSGLTAEPSRKVLPPRVKESPLSFECQLEALLEFGSGQLGSSTLVVGRVVAVHVRDELYEDGRLAFEKLDPLSRLGGLWYGKTFPLVEIPRPKLS